VISRARARIVRHRRALAILAILGALYCAAIEAWLPRIDPIPSSAPRVVIALNGGVRDDGTLNPTSAARLDKAITYAREHAATLVTTNVQDEDDPTLTSNADQRRIIEAAGYADRWIALPGYALTTRDEAERFRKVVKPAPIVLVTSRLHTRRACKTFETLGYAVTCVSSGLDGPWWLLPYSVAYESAAWIKYRAKGWI
jgi:uncharacterized SAM-binding protein YcdF (DUF218 family)